MREVSRCLKKKETGIVILAGNVKTRNILRTIPRLCKRHGIPYVFGPCKKELAAAMGVKGGCVAVFIRDDKNIEYFDEVKNEIKRLKMSK